MSYLTCRHCFTVDFFPFCDPISPSTHMDLAKQCVPCSSAFKAGLAATVNGSVVSICNPLITSYPLALSECTQCNKALLDGILSYIIIILVCTVVLNSWSIVVWLHAKNRRPQIYFKLSLTVSDLLFGAIVLPEVTYNLINTMYVGHTEYYAFYKLTDLTLEPGSYWDGWERLFQPVHGKVSFAILCITQEASLCSLLLLSIDRHIAIAHGIRYTSIMTNKRSLIIVAGMWASVIVLTLLSTFLMGDYLLFRTKPSALFLPMAHPKETQHYIAMMLLAIVPMSVVFAANVMVTGYTYVKLNKTARTTSFSHGGKRKSTFASLSEATSASIAESTVFVLTGPEETIADDYKNEGDQDVKPDRSASQTRLTSNDESPFKNQDSIGNDVIELCPYSGQDVMNVARRETKFNKYDCSDPRRLSPRESATKNGNKPGLFNANFVTFRSSSQSFPTFSPFMPQTESWIKGARNGRKHKKQQDPEHAQANRTLILILLVYTICVLPLVVLLVVNLFDDDLLTGKALNKGTKFDARSIGFVVTVGVFMTSSIWNCVIYNVRNRDYRSSAISLIYSLRSRCTG